MGYYTSYSGAFTFSKPLHNAALENELRVLCSEELYEKKQQPKGSPDYWCPWVLSDLGDELEIPEEGKHYTATEWLTYINDKMLKPHGIWLEGAVAWKGESDDDCGTIYAKDGKIEAVDDDIRNPGPSWDRDVIVNLTSEEAKAVRSALTYVTNTSDHHSEKTKSIMEGVHKKLAR